jgi:rubrerythrin
MKNSVGLGMNKTGLGLAPKMAEEMLDDADDIFKPYAHASDDLTPELNYREVKQDIIQEWSTVGSLPPPATIRGVAKTGIEKLMGRQPEMLLDKLGERLAFERTGVRLYEALIAKCEVALPNESWQFLRDIRNDELRHFHLLHEAIEEIGADPTAITPCANATAMASQGLIAVVNDPRTDVAQSAQAILLAELADNEGWEMLIELTDRAGLDEQAKRFRAAQMAEEEHLAKVRRWLRQLTMANDIETLQ